MRIKKCNQRKQSIKKKSLMIQVNELTFSYPKSKHSVFEGLNLQLNENRILRSLKARTEQERVRCYIL